MGLTSITTIYCHVLHTKGLIGNVASHVQWLHRLACRRMRLRVETDTPQWTQTWGGKRVEESLSNQVRLHGDYNRLHATPTHWHKYLEDGARHSRMGGTSMGVWNCRNGQMEFVPQFPPISPKPPPKLVAQRQRGKWTILICVFPATFSPRTLNVLGKSQIALPVSSWPNMSIVRLHRYILFLPN